MTIQLHFPNDIVDRLRAIAKALLCVIEVLEQLARFLPYIRAFLEGLANDEGQGKSILDAGSG